MPSYACSLIFSLCAALSVISVKPNSKHAELQNKCDSKEIKFGFGRIEIILGKGENAGYQHFLLFPKRFQKPPFSVKSRD